MTFDAITAGRIGDGSFLSNWSVILAIASYRKLIVEDDQILRRNGAIFLKHEANNGSAAGASQRADRTGGDGIDGELLLAAIDRPMADRGFPTSAIAESGARSRRSAHRRKPERYSRCEACATLVRGLIAR